MVNYIFLYKKFVEHHVIKLILLKISKLSAHLTQAIIRDKLQRLKHTQDISLYTSINYNVQMHTRLIKATILLLKCNYLITKQTGPSVVKRLSFLQDCFVFKDFN